MFRKFRDSAEGSEEETQRLIPQLEMSVAANGDTSGVSQTSQTRSRSNSNANSSRPSSARSSTHHSNRSSTAETVSSRPRSFSLNSQNSSHSDREDEDFASEFTPQKRDILGAEADSNAAKAAAREAVVRIKRAFNCQGEKMQLWPDDTGDFLFEVRVGGATKGRVRHVAADFVFFDNHQKVVHTEKADVLINGLPEFRQTVPSAAVAHQILEAFEGKHAVEKLGGKPLKLTPLDAGSDGSDHYNYHVEYDGRVRGYAKVDGNAVLFFDLKHHQLLCIPQGHLPSLLFGGDTIVREIRKLYGDKTARVQLIPHHDRHFTHKVLCNSRDVGFAIEAPEAFSFYDLDGKLLLDIHKNE